jgi:hypothetical protein
VLKSVALAALAGVLGALSFWFLSSQANFALPTRQAARETGALSATPGLDIVDRIKCQRWQQKLVVVDGQEDGFARAGLEPARIDPRLLKDGYFKDLSDGRNRSIVIRNYDDGGSDKYFTDWFELPRGIDSAKLVLRVRSAAGADNDNIRLGDLFDDPAGHARHGTTEFGMRLVAIKERNQLADGSELLTIDLSQLANGFASMANEDFLTWANSSQRSDRLEVAIGDDTEIDFMAMSLCLAPSEHRGTTFREFHNRSIGEDLSWLQCNGDFSQPGCDPFSGDLSCKAAMPLGCFKPGDVQPDVERLKRLDLPVDSFSGGTVQMTEPIAAATFPTLASANAFCSARFGAGWRVLSYHEGGGGGVVSYSRIPSKARMWIDIADQPHANCWDRDRVRKR